MKAWAIGVILLIGLTGCTTAPEPPTACTDASLQTISTELAALDDASKAAMRAPTEALTGAPNKAARATLVQQAESHLAKLRGAIVRAKIACSGDPATMARIRTLEQNLGGADRHLSSLKGHERQLSELTGR